LQALWAETDRPVIGGPALGSGGTTAGGASINTLAGDTCGGGAAVGVAGTARQADGPLAQMALQYVAKKSEKY
jgi:hypothetical protein